MGIITFSYISCIIICISYTVYHGKFIKCQILYNGCHIVTIYFRGIYIILYFYISRMNIVQIYIFFYY
jgi:hypothetical protein